MSVSGAWLPCGRSADSDPEFAYGVECLNPAVRRGLMSGLRSKQVLPAGNGGSFHAGVLRDSWRLYSRILLKP